MRPQGIRPPRPGEDVHNTAGFFPPPPDPPPGGAAAAGAAADAMEVDPSGPGGGPGDDPPPPPRPPPPDPPGVGFSSGADPQDRIPLVVSSGGPPPPPSGGSVALERYILEDIPAAFQNLDKLLNKVQQATGESALQARELNQLKDRLDDLQESMRDDFDEGLKSLKGSQTLDRAMSEQALYKRMEYLFKNKFQELERNTISQDQLLREMRDTVMRRLQDISAEQRRLRQSNQGEPRPDGNIAELSKKVDSSFETLSQLLGQLLESSETLQNQEQNRNLKEFLGEARGLSEKELTMLEEGLRLSNQKYNTELNQPLPQHPTDPLADEYEDESSTGREVMPLPMTPREVKAQKNYNKRVNEQEKKILKRAMNHIGSNLNTFKKIPKISERPVIAVPPLPKGVYSPVDPLRPLGARPKDSFSGGPYVPPSPDPTLSGPDGGSAPDPKSVPNVPNPTLLDPKSGEEGISIDDAENERRRPFLAEEDDDMGILNRNPPVISQKPPPLGTPEDRKQEEMEDQLRVKNALFDSIRDDINPKPPDDSSENPSLADLDIIAGDGGDEEMPQRGTKRGPSNDLYGNVSIEKRRQHEEQHHPPRPKYGQDLEPGANLDRGAAAAAAAGGNNEPDDDDDDDDDEDDDESRAARQRRRRKEKERQYNARRGEQDDSSPPSQKGQGKKTRRFYRALYESIAKPTATATLQSLYRKMKR